MPSPRLSPMDALARPSWRPYACWHDDNRLLMHGRLGGGNRGNSALGCLRHDFLFGGRSRNGTPKPTAYAPVAIAVAQLSSGDLRAPYSPVQRGPRRACALLRLLCLRQCTASSDQAPLSSRSSMIRDEKAGDARVGILGSDLVFNADPFDFVGGSGFLAIGRFLCSGLVSLPTAFLG